MEKGKKKSKMGFIEVKLAVWEAWVLVFWDCTKQEAADFIKKEYKGIPQEIVNNLEAPRECQAVTYFTPDSANSVIWVSQPFESLDFKLNVFHEAIHAMFRIMGHWKIESNTYTEEVLITGATYICRKVLTPSNIK